ncbi:hypothetical protein CHLNCDRAFT_140922, partial [Chlorella variabilis]
MRPAPALVWAAALLATLGAAAPAAAQLGTARFRAPPPKKPPPRKPPPPRRGGAAAVSGAGAVGAGRPLSPPRPRRPPARPRPTPRVQPIQLPKPVTLPGGNTRPWSGGRLLPADRALDWTHAGYREGRLAIPTPPIRYNVRAFGAKGDGASDDTEAIQAAVRVANRAPGVIFFPPGTYILTRPISLYRGRTVLRGAGPGQSIVHIPLSLSEVYQGTWTSDASGNVKSAWSSGGAFITFAGRRQRSDNARTLLATITGPVAHGSNRIPVGSVARLRVGQRIRIFVNDASTLSSRRRLLQQQPAQQPARNATAAGAAGAAERPPNAVRMLAGAMPAAMLADPVVQLAMLGQAQLGEDDEVLTPEQAAAVEAGWAAAARSGGGGTDVEEGDGEFRWEEAWPASQDAASEAWDGGDEAGVEEEEEPGAAASPPPPSSSASPPPAPAPAPPPGPPPPVDIADEEEGEEGEGEEEANAAAAAQGQSALAAALAAAGYDLSDLSTAAFEAGAAAATAASAAGASAAGAAAGGGAIGAQHPANQARAAVGAPGGGQAGANTVLAWAYGEGLSDTGTDETVIDKDEVAMTA